MFECLVKKWGEFLKWLYYKKLEDDDSDWDEYLKYKLY